MMEEIWCLAAITVYSFSSIEGAIFGSILMEALMLV